MSSTRAIRESTKQMVSHGMKMSNLRKVLLWKSRLQFNIDRMIQQSKDW